MAISSPIHSQPVRRATTHVAAYLVLRRGNDLLLSLRQKTGYCDGAYGLVSGHVEEGESATSGMIREAYEEAGILLLPSQLRVAHIGHRRTNRFVIDIFFECSEWSGELCNREPERCAELAFFPQAALPSNIVDYIAAALGHIEAGCIYSETGWS